MAAYKKDKAKEVHRENEIWARERREFLERERSYWSAPLFKRL